MAALGRDETEQVDQNQQGHDGDADKGHAPTGIKADDPPQGKAEDHGYGRAGNDHAQGQGPMYPGD